MFTGLTLLCIIFLTLKLNVKLFSIIMLIMQNNVVALNNVMYSHDSHVCLSVVNSEIPIKFVTYVLESKHSSCGRLRVMGPSPNPLRF